MILKSLGHKTRSFGKLLTYVQRGAETDGAGGTFSRNLLCDAQDVEAVRQAFEENARHLKARRGGELVLSRDHRIAQSGERKNTGAG